MWESKNNWVTINEYLIINVIKVPPYRLQIYDLTDIYNMSVYICMYMNTYLFLNNLLFYVYGFWCSIISKTDSYTSVSPSSS